MTTLNGILIRQLRRELLLAYRRRGDALTPLLFFIIVITLFPLGISPEKVLLQQFGAGALWIAALLASMLSLQRLFTTDHGNGVLEQLLVTPCPLSFLLATKLMAHWLSSGLPLVFLSPLLAEPFGLEWSTYPALVAGLLLGTPVLLIIGAISAALTVGLRGGGLLLTLLTLPLYVPVLIFGTGAVMAVSRGMSAAPHLSLLGAMCLVSLTFGPWLTALALKISLD
ncbi:MAG: heme exporter protein CcmB [Gammaproteobacteria bacterium]|nr:heme exporter protein CcmB [Gammaproteobacteria bacterium]